MNTPKETKQRAAIREVFSSANRPLNVSEILDAAQAKGLPNLGIATVYRNLKGMVASGEIVMIPGVNIPPCYAAPELAKLCQTIPLYQDGNKLYQVPPNDFVKDGEHRIITGHRKAS